MADAEATDTAPMDHETSEDGEESDEAKLTRNWNELLQELRVTQTGVQILTGFLLTLPFTQRFTELDSLQKNVYLCVISGSVIATGLIVGPVAFHRLLFRQGMRSWLVAAANQSARAGLVFLALTTCGVIWLVFDVVTNRALALWAMALAVLFFAVLWGGVPYLARKRR